MTKVWACETCDLCRGESKGFYYFDKDLKKSINSVEEVVNDIREHTPLDPQPTDIEKSGDILLVNKEGNRVARVEVKLITTTFKKVEIFLPNGDLKPFETVVIDEPKLRSYFFSQSKEGIPHYIVVKLTRPCRNGAKVYARLENLKTIYDEFGKKRFYRRRLGAGDGKKGILEKYHFSIDRDFSTNYMELFEELNKL